MPVQITNLIGGAPGGKLRDSGSGNGGLLWQAAGRPSHDRSGALARGHDAPDRLDVGPKVRVVGGRGSEPAVGAEPVIIVRGIHELREEVLHARKEIVRRIAGRLAA